MSFFEHLLRGWMGDKNSGHHGKRRNGHHGGYTESNNAYTPPRMQGPVCGQCNASNSPDARFCAQCGMSLQALPCAACNKNIPAGAKFCPACGQSARKTSP